MAQLKEPAFNSMTNRWVFMRDAEQDSPDNTKRASYRPTLPLSDMEAYLRSIDGSTKFRVGEQESGRSYKMLVVAEWPDGLYAFDAAGEFIPVYGKFIDWYFQRIGEKFERDGALAVGPKTEATGKSPLLPNRQLKWGITGPGDEGDGHGDINDYSSLLLEISFTQPVSQPRPEHGCSLPLSDAEFRSCSELVLEHLRAEGFSVLETDGHHYVYNRAIVTPVPPFLVAEKRIDAFEGDAVKRLAERTRGVFQNSDLGGDVNLTAFIREGDLMVYPDDHLYYCDAMNPVILDDFGEHQRLARAL